MGTSGSALQVNWKGPVECGPADELERSVVRLLGQHAESADVTVQATASQLESGNYRIELELSGKVSGIRSLESKDCGEAVQASAVVLALAINPNALDGSDPAKQEADPPPPTASAAKQQESPPPVVPTPPSTLHFVAGVQGRLSGGLAPFPRWGVGLEAGLAWSYFYATLGGFFDPGPWQDLDPDGRARFWKSGGRADFCARVFKLARLSGRLCGGLTLTSLRSETENLTDAETPSAWLISPAFGASLVVRVTPHFRLVGSGGFEIPTTRPRFVITDENNDPLSVYQIAMGGTIRLGLEFALPVSR